MTEENSAGLPVVLATITQAKAIEFDDVSDLAWVASRDRGDKLLQRGLRSSVVEGYAREMRSGAWHPECGDMILIDKYGRIINGQHRIKAVIMTGITIQAYVRFNAPVELIHIADKGRSRSTADDMQIDGHKNSSTLSAVSKLIYRYHCTRNMANLRHKLTYSDSKVILESYPYIFEVVEKYCSRKYATDIVSPSWVCFLAVIVHENYQKEILSFFNRLDTGANLSQQSPVLALIQASRNWDRTINRSVATHYKTAITVKAWNKFIGEEKIKRLMWNPTKGFPRIIGATLKKPVLDKIKI